MMEREKKTNLNLEMFKGVNYFTGLDRDNLVVDGDVSPYVPSDVKILWFRSVNAKGIIKTQMVGSLEDTVRYKLCVFSAEVYDNDNKMLAMGYGSASTDEDGFIGHAERRAVGKALTHAGFTWHNGDFSMDMDVAKTFLNLYNSYINNGTLDINDTQVTQMYDDALVTVLPEGYGYDTGKPIAAMDQKHLEEIAKNYAMVDSGNPLVNAKIKFVYMYQLIQKESEKKPETKVDFGNELANNQAEKEDKPKKTRKSRKTKETPVAEPAVDVAEQEELEPVAETAKQLDEEPVMEEEQPVTAETEENVAEDEPVAAIDEQVSMDEPFDMTEDETEDVAADEEYDAEELAGVFDFVAKNEGEMTAEEPSQEDSENMTEQEFNSGFHLDDGEEEPPFFESDVEDYVEGEMEFGGFALNDANEAPIDSAETDDFDIQGDFQKENHKQEVLRSWGYKTEEELTSNWKAHLDKVRDKFYALIRSNATEVTVKEFVENIPIFDNFLWKEKSDQNTIVLLGDFMKEHEEDVRMVVKNGTSIPANTVKAYMEWYIDHVWDEF